MKETYRVLVMVSCDDARKEELEKISTDQYKFSYAGCFEQVSAEQLQEAHIIIGEPDKEQLLQAKNLQWIQMTWAGADRYTNMAEFPMHVQLTNASGAFGVIIAEYVMGAILSMYRQFPLYWEQQKNCVWKEEWNEETIIGKRVLILGTGDVGSQIAKRIKAFGTHVTGLNRSGKKSCQDFDEVYTMENLDTQLPMADIVISCLPGTKETIGLMHKEKLLLMKQNAFLVNVGRGNLFIRRDLEEVLLEGHLKGAVLDVFDVEPLPADSPLWSMENVMITPHIAGPTFGGDVYTTECIWQICKDNLKRFVEKEPLLHVVDRNIGY